MQINVCTEGVYGDGLHDDSQAIQQILDHASGKTVYFPAGTYRVVHTLYISSGTTILADENCRIFHCGTSDKHYNDFLITNRDFSKGNQNITIDGGIWDGNYDGIKNTKPNDIFAPDAWSGSMINFINVHNLTLKNMRAVNSVVYYFRFGQIDGFHIDNIHIGARKLSFNQDGFHFSGGCRNGIITNIFAEDMEVNDDLLAINADDNLERLENRGLLCGNIENLVFENIFAPNTYTLTRMASITSTISNIHFKNIECGCRFYAINMDGLRYCHTPICHEEDFPDGCGRVENILFENFRIYSTADRPCCPLILAEERMKNFRITGFERLFEKDRNPDSIPTLSIKNVSQTHISITRSEKTDAYYLKNKSDALQFFNTFDSLVMNSDSL